MVLAHALLTATASWAPYVCAAWAALGFGNSVLSC